MNDIALAITYIGVIAVLGTVVAVIALARARVAQARSGAEHLQRYRQFAERCTADQQRAAEELGRLTDRLADRLAAVEKLLREVG
jgi:hypothetical protein